MTLKEAAAAVREDHRHLGTAGPEAWDEFRESLGKLLALCESDSVLVPRATLERVRETVFRLCNDMADCECRRPDCGEPIHAAEHAFAALDAMLNPNPKGSP